MQKPSRNEPCHCGSGKKYKKCCINKDEFEHLHADNDFKPNFSPKDKKHNALLKYKKNEVLKVLAFLQMLPQNHGKNIRIELLLTDILNADLQINEAINYQNLRNDLKKDCTKHPYEDPPEDFFTENIVFVNGNNIVYPGIFTRAADIVQSQLNAIFKDKNLPFQAVREIVEGTFFLLTLYGEIAKKLGHVHRLFEEAKEEALYIPPTSEIISNKGLFSFSYEQLTGLCDRLAISKGVVSEFVLDIDKKVSFSNPDSNPLFRKPFVRIENEIILVMPTAELSAINNFLLEKLKQYNCVGQFTENFSNLTRQDVSMALRHMGWSALKNDFLKSETFDEIVVDQGVYQFDSNKIGYTLTVTHIPGDEKKRVADFAPSNKKIVEIALAASRVLKSKFHDYKIFLLIVLDRCDIFETYFLDYSGIKNFDQYLALTTQELNVIPKRWHFDALTLWKYASQAEENRDKMMFMPQNTHLSKFNWYKENFDCFFHPDKEPFNFAVFEFDIEGNVNRTAKLKIDKIGIPFKAERGTVHLPSRRKEEHYPVYISDEFRHGYFRNCLLRYSCPVWLQSNTVRDYTSDVYINGILYWLNQSFDDLNEFFAVLGKEPIVITLIMDKAFDDKDKWDIEAGPDYAELSHQIIAENRAIEINLPISIINHLMNSGNSGEKFLMVAIVRIISSLISSLGLNTVLSDTDIKDVFDKVIQNPMHKMIIIAEASDNPIIADIDVDSPRYIQNADISYILHNQVSWLDKSIKIPKKITLTAEKVNLLNALVSVHFKRIIQSIAKYDEVALLAFLMNRHESLIQVREMRKLSYPTQEACYGQFYNVFEKFGKTESEIVSSSLAVRTLIEFVACERPKGKEICMTWTLI